MAAGRRTGHGAGQDIADTFVGRLDEVWLRLGTLVPVGKKACRVTPHQTVTIFRIDASSDGISQAPQAEHERAHDPDRSSSSGWAWGMTRVASLRERWPDSLAVRGGTAMGSTVRIGNAASGDSAVFECLGAEAHD